MTGEPEFESRRGQRLLFLSGGTHTYPVSTGRNVKPMSRLHLVPRLRMCPHGEMPNEAEEWLYLCFTVCLIYVTRNKHLIVARVEVGSNASTAALRVVGDDEKGAQCLGV
jgi:hypothetical protein